MCACVVGKAGFGGVLGGWAWACVWGGGTFSHIHIHIHTLARLLRPRFKSQAAQHDSPLAVHSDTIGPDYGGLNVPFGGRGGLRGCPGPS